MGTMKKLLHKPLKAFAIYSFVVLLCSIPVYFFIIDYIWIREINQHNRIKSESAKQNLQALKLEERELKQGIALWNKLQPEAKIQEVSAMLPDSSYNIYRKNRYITSKGYDRFEGLVTYFKLNNMFYSITVETNVEESYETIFVITAITASFFLVLLTGFIILNEKISKKLWSPFYHSLQKIRSFNLSSQQKPTFEKTDIAEFEEMNTSISRLIDSNIDVYRQQKEFTENASHELQTPLAIVQSKLDLLLQSSALSEEQSAIIDHTNKALARVSRINRNLLLLAKIENQQFADKEQINLSAQLQEQISLLSDFLLKKNLKIEQQIKPNIIIEGNKVLVEILLTNLLMNAIRHNIKNGLIRITLNNNSLRILNTGITGLNEEKIFKRFSTASSGNPGTGLGLAIVKEICNQQGWQLSYLFENKLHIFSITI
jgi:signal transduction histidine kinase